MAGRSLSIFKEWRRANGCAVASQEQAGGADKKTK
jgi:hypothetical protein